MNQTININWLNYKARLYQLMPPILKYYANFLRKIPTFLNWKLSQNGMKHTKELLIPYKGKYKNHRCVIIGNGPSLNSMDLSILKNEYTFGLNRIYLLFEELGFETNFFVCSNGLVQTQFAKEISNIRGPKFLNWEYRKGYVPNDSTAFLCPRIGQKTMDGQILNGYYPTYGSVTNIALQLAFYMGFSEVILIGVDHNYSAKGKPGEAIVENSEDKNHFSKDYFGPGTIWQLPNYQTMESGYRAAKEMFERDSRKVVDATVNGHLYIFDKVNFAEYLEKSTSLNSKSEK
jgi:hypothetical protein